MRREKELLQLLLDNIHEIKKAKGLCMLIILLRANNEITTEEYNLLDYYFAVNLPDRKKSAYSWIPGNIFWRKRWLKKQIKKL